MDTEYKHFTRVNQNLALIVEDLRLRQEGLLNEVRKMKVHLEIQDTTKRQLRDDLAEMFVGFNDDKKLKNQIISLHKRWVLNETRHSRIEKDSVSERRITQ